MIGKLKGIIDSYGEDFIVLDVNGVGYLVQCSARTLQELPGVGQPTPLAIETYVREDQIRLFGFRTDVEREWFRLLQTVQGVGAKVALSVLGTLKPADLASAIAMLVPAIAGLPVAEYAPNLVKKTIVGAGHCEKVQIRLMVKVLLPTADPQSDDAADALAVAVTHAHHRQSAVARIAVS